MKQPQIRMVLGVIVLVSAHLMMQCTTAARATGSEPIKTAPMAKIKKTNIKAFELPVPEEEHRRDYLGIPDQGSFQIEQIETEVLLVEVFSMYCSHCQKEAPRVNELFRSIEQESTLKGRIKIIGIGATNSPYEVNLFKEKFNVPFPLFADQDSSVSNKLGIEMTPTFIGIRFFEDGSHVVFHFDSGAFGEVAEFLDTIVRKSRLTE